MEIKYYGANCVRITTKNAAVTIDDNLDDIGLKSPMKAGDIALYSFAHASPAKDAKLVIDQPGEYEVSDISIRGASARAHIDEEQRSSATIFKLIVDDIRIVSLGHIYPDLDEDQLETIGTVDVLLVPVGGNGYTLDSIGALKVIRKIGPKIVIPTHYGDTAIKYPVPQQNLDDALKGLSMESKETLDKLKLKSSDLVDVTQLFVLTRQ